MSIYKKFDNNGYEYYINVSIEGNFLHMGAYDNNNINMASLSSFVGDKKIYLDSIFCYPFYRNRGIASELLNILNEYANGSVIYGTYSPFEIGSMELDNEPDISATKSFYEKNGYEVVTFDNYIEHKDNYPRISETDFGMTRRSSHNAIIYKKEKKKIKIKILK